MSFLRFFSGLLGGEQSSTQNFSEGAAPLQDSETDIKPIVAPAPAVRFLQPDSVHQDASFIQTDQPQVSPNSVVRIQPSQPKNPSGQTMRNPQQGDMVVTNVDVLPSAPSPVVQKKLDAYKGGVIQNVATAFAHTFWPTKAAESQRTEPLSGKNTSTDQEYATAVNSKIVEEHPFEAMLGAFAGTMGNLLLQGIFVPLGGTKEAVQTALANKLPMDYISLLTNTTGGFLSRVAGAVTEGGLRFGLNGLITEALDQAGTKEFSAGKMATATAKSVGAGAAFGLAEAPTTAVGQLVTAGLAPSVIPFGQMLYKAWKTGEFSTQDMVNLWTTAAVSMALHAMSVDQTAAKNAYEDWRGYETRNGLTTRELVAKYGGTEGLAEFDKYTSAADWARHNPEAAREMSVESTLIPPAYDLYAQEFAKPQVRQETVLQSVPESFKTDFVRLPAATRSDIIKNVAEQVKDGTDLGIAVKNAWDAFADVVKFVHEAWNLGGGESMVTAMATGKTEAAPKVMADAVAQTQLELGQKPDAVRRSEEKARIEAPAPVPMATRIPKATMYEVSGNQVTPVQVSFDSVLTVQGDQYDLVEQLKNAGAPQAAEVLRDFDYTEADQFIRQTLGNIYDAVRFVQPAVADGKTATQAEVFDINRNVYLSETPKQAKSFSEQGLRSAHQPYEAPAGLVSGRVQQSRAAAEKVIRQFAAAEELPVKFVREMFVREGGQLQLNPDTGRPVRAFGVYSPADNTITLADLRRGNTAKHEVAEYFWANHVSAEDKEAVLDEMASRFPNLDRHELKEQVMEEFTHWSDGRRTAGKLGEFFASVRKLSASLKRTGGRTEELFRNIEKRVRPAMPEGIGRQEGFLPDRKAEPKLRAEIEELAAREAASAASAKEWFGKVRFQSEDMVLDPSVVRSGEPITDVNADSHNGLDVTAAERFRVEKLKRLGAGSDRITYALSDRLALKVAKTLRGLIQNSSERDWYAIQSGLIPIVYESGMDYVVVRRAEPANKGEARAKIEAMLAPVRQFSAIEYDYKDDGVLAAIEAINPDFNNYDLLFGDFTRASSWGFIDGKPILIDAGTLNGRLNTDDKTAWRGDWREILKRRRAVTRKALEEYQSEAESMLVRKAKSYYQAADFAQDFSWLWRDGSGFNTPNLSFDALDSAGRRTVASLAKLASTSPENIHKSVVPLELLDASVAEGEDLNPDSRATLKGQPAVEVSITPHGDIELLDGNHRVLQAQANGHGAIEAWVIDKSGFIKNLREKYDSAWDFFSLASRDSQYQSEQLYATLRTILNPMTDNSDATPLARDTLEQAIKEYGTILSAKEAAGYLSETHGNAFLLNDGTVVGTDEEHHTGFLDQVAEMAGVGSGAFLRLYEKSGVARIYFDSNAIVQFTSEKERPAVYVDSRLNLNAAQLNVLRVIGKGRKFIWDIGTPAKRGSSSVFNQLQRDNGSAQYQSEPSKPFRTAQLKGVFFHGGTSDGSFSDEKINSRFEGGYGRGFNFTPDKQRAVDYARIPNGKVVSVRLGVKNPFVWDALLPIQHLMRKFGVDANDAAGAQSGVTEKLKKLGYDGVAVVSHWDGSLQEVVVFDAAQIKKVKVESPVGMMYQSEPAKPLSEMSFSELAAYAKKLAKENEELMAQSWDVPAAKSEEEIKTAVDADYQSESLKSRILGSIKPKPAEIVTNEYRLLKARVRSFAEGIREGRRDAATELAELKAIVVASAQQLPSEDRAKLLTAVANLKTLTDVDKALGRIGVLADQAIRREAVASIKDTGALVKAAERTGRYLPLDYQRRIRELLSGLDLTKPSAATVAKAAALSEYLMSEESSRWQVPQEYIDTLARLGRTNVSELKTEDLKGLADTLNHLTELGVLKLKMLSFAGERERQAALQQLLTTTVNLDTRHGLIPSKWDRAKADAAKLWYSGLHFFRVADAMDGMMDYQGQNVQLQRHVANAETRAKMEAMAVKSGVLKAISEIKADWKEEDWARLAWHVYARQGGLKQAETLNGVYGVKFGDLSDPLTPELESVWGILIDAFRPNEGRLKAAYETIENRPFAKTPNYFPFRYERTEALDIPSVDEMLNQGGFSTKETEQGFTVRRVKGVRRIPRIDLLNVFSSAVDDQMWYVNVQPALNDVHSLVNDDAYKEQAGRIATELWKEWMNAVAHRGQVRTDNPLLRTLRQNVGQAYLGYSLTSVAIQPFAIFEAVAYLEQSNQFRHPVRAVARVLGEFVKNWTVPTVTGREVAKSDMLQLRAGGEFAVEEGLAKFDRKLGDSALTRAAKAFQRGAMRLLQEADLKTSAATRQGIYDALVAEGVPTKQAATQADFLMNVVASSSETADRPLLLSKSEGWKALFTFKTFALSKSGLLLHDLLTAGIVRGRIGKKAAAFIGLLIVLLGNWLSDRMRQYFNRTLMGKKPLDQSGLKSPLMDAVFALPEAVPIVGDLLAGARKFGTADIGIPALRPIQDIFTGAVNSASAKTDSAKVKAVVQISSGFAALLGIAGTAQAARLLPLLMLELDGQPAAPTRGARTVPKRTTPARPKRVTNKR